MKIVLCFLVILCLISPALPAAPGSLGEAITRGSWSLNARFRGENVEQTGLRDATALTLRTRLGFSTAPLRGWQAMLEVENIVALDEDGYNQAGLNPGGAGRAVIADPEGTEINQAWLAWRQDRTVVTLGRQRLVLDNARFIGDVGWRQNMQTFDALVVQDKSLDQTTLTYAYLDQVNRIFGDRHVQGKWQSDAHVFNAGYAGFSAGTLAAYMYLLDFEPPAAANSCATYGLSFTGSRPLTAALKLVYRAELATQSDRGSSPLDYRATYAAIEAGLAGPGGTVAIGQERLGSDGGNGFRTPLATLHAFNGWADLFLAPPGTGLRDTYLKVLANLPDKFALLGFYHHFSADRSGMDYGRELDLQLTRKFDSHFTGTVKYAKFDRELSTLPNVTKFWLQVDCAY